MNSNRRLVSAVFLCSLSSLAFEVALTRVFSISLGYHFAFMVVSIAMLGLGASGTALSLAPSLRKLGNVGAYCLALGIAMSLSYLIANRIPFDPVELRWSSAGVLYILLYYLVLSLPFFFTGLILATVLSHLSAQSGLLYGADLLGAGLGSAAVLGLMTVTGAENVVFVLSTAALSACLLAGPGRLAPFVLAAIACNLLILLTQPGFSSLRMSPYKGLQAALKYPGAQHLKTYVSPFTVIDTFRSPAVRFAPGLSLRYLEPLPEQVGFSADGTSVNAVTSAADRTALTFLRHLPAALPYESGIPEEVLILDPKGGLHVLLAREYRAARIETVESNPLLVRVMKEDFFTFSGGVYGEEAGTGLGRSWLSAGGRRFDLIDMPLIEATPSGSFGIAEDYRFTREAVERYLAHLTPRGFLSFNLYILSPPRTELRLLATVVDALEKTGAKNAAEHIAAVRSWGALCILVKKDPLSPAEVESVRRFAADRRFDLVHLPGIREEDTNVFVRTTSNDYFHAFRDIIDPATRQHFMAHYLFDIRPVTDDRPFFSYHLRAATFGEIFRVIGGKWYFFLEEGYLLPVIFAQVAFVGLVLMLLPAWAGTKPLKGAAESEKASGLSFLPYFALLGLGFMFVEVGLMQRATLPLEHPVYAVGTVLTSLLVGSGIGSLLSQRKAQLRAPSVLLIGALLAVVCGVLMPRLTENLSGLSLPLKIAAVFLLLLPLGVPLGTPFPSGLRLLGGRTAWLIPWAWAVNGCFSVVAPVVAVMTALVLGFDAVLLLGAAAYMAAYAMIRRWQG